MFGTRKLGRTTDAAEGYASAADHRPAGERSSIETTVTRAKEVQPIAEKMITLGKERHSGSYRRRALAFITKEDVVTKLFKEIAPNYAERNGGYTRITRIGVRRGDAAEKAVIELV